MFGDLFLFKIENLEKFEKELSRLFLFYNDGELHFEKNFQYLSNRNDWILW